MPEQSKYAILILAAGASKRMGRPKQLLKWKESNLLNYSISIANKLLPYKVFVVLGANASLIIPKIQSKEVKILINENWEQGLGSSISSGLTKVIKTNPEIEGVLIMLTDQPLIKPDHYLKLVNGFNPNQKQILATKYNDGKPGVPALFNKFFFAELCDLNSDYGAKQLINKYTDHVVFIKNGQSKFDIDTPEQYANLYKENH